MPRAIRRRSLAVFAASLAALVSAVTASAAPVIEVGRPFPAVELPSIDDGRLVSIADFRGRRVVLHVFASW